MPRELKHFFFSFFNTRLSQCDRACACAQVTAYRGDLCNNRVRHVHISQLLMYGFTTSDFWAYSVYCEVKRKIYLADLLIFWEFQATCCSIIFGSRVLGSLYYRSAAFSDHVQEVLPGPFKQCKSDTSTPMELKKNLMPVFLHICGIL